MPLSVFFKKGGVMITTKFRIFFLSMALVGLAGCQTTPQVSSADVDEIRISEFSESKQTGQMKLTSEWINKKKVTMLGSYEDTAVGMKDVSVAVQRQRGGPAAGTYFIGVYLKASGTGSNMANVLTFVPEGKGHLISYTVHKRQLLTFCKGDECTVTKFESKFPSAHFPGVIATLYVIGNGEHMIGVRRAEGGVCDVIVARPMKSGESPFENWVDKRVMTLSHGETGEIANVGRVRCRVDSAESPKSSASLELPGS